MSLEHPVIRKTKEVFKNSPMVIANILKEHTSNNKKKSPKVQVTMDFYKI